MEEPLTPDFRSFQVPDLGYYKKTATTTATGVDDEQVLAARDLTQQQHVTEEADDNADDSELETLRDQTLSQQVRDDSGSDYDTDIELPRKYMYTQLSYLLQLI